MVGFLRAESGMKLCQGAAAWHGEDGGLENHPSVGESKQYMLFHPIHMIYIFLTTDRGTIY